MEFVYEPALLEYMQKKGKRTIIVEVVAANHSDIEVQDFHVHFVNDKQAAYFKEKKRFRAKTTPYGEVLLPNYRLEYDDTITFGLKSFLGIKQVTQKGIRF